MEGAIPKTSLPVWDSEMEPIDSHRGSRVIPYAGKNIHLSHAVIGNQVLVGYPAASVISRLGTPQGRTNLQAGLESIGSDIAAGQHPHYIAGRLSSLFVKLYPRVQAFTRDNPDVEFYL